MRANAAFLLLAFPASRTQNPPPGGPAPQKVSHEQAERLPAEPEDRPAPAADRVARHRGAPPRGPRDQAREEEGQGRRRGGERSRGEEAPLGQAADRPD